jgi:hypothetical protein
MDRLDDDEVRGKQLLEERQIDVLALSYEDMVDRDELEITHLNGEVSSWLCDWLGVEGMRLSVRPARRVNPEPLCELVSNWPEVRGAVANSAWAQWLEDEGRWS